MAILQFFCYIILFLLQFSLDKHMFGRLSWDQRLNMKKQTYFPQNSYMPEVSIMTIQDMKRRKTELGLTNEMLSERSGIPLSTIQKIFCGATKAPRKSTLDALAAVLRPTEEEILGGAAPYVSAGAVREPFPAYAAKKKPGEFTVDDYYALPDDRRAELLDGVFYDMATPSLLHQTILLELAFLFQKCISEHEMPCRVIISPSDVRLDLDDRTMLQPDLYITCKKVDLNLRAYPGAPDLAVEVLSPATRNYDMLLKAYKYGNAGVREYWIVDPKNRVVMVYDFTDPDSPATVYSFEADIPVLISDGKCVIPFREVSDTVAEAYEPRDQ